jgi:hypothetical protein
MPRHGGKLGKAGKGRVDRDSFAKPRGERLLHLLGTGVI